MVVSQQTIAIPTETNAAVHGDLVLPNGATSIVLFAHGSGSSRLSPRNRYVASVLNNANIGTFLLDLLTSDEEHRDIIDASLRFNIPFLARRLNNATDFLRQHVPDTRDAAFGYFGASTGAAAALVASTLRPPDDPIAAIVSRGGRPDLAGEKALRSIKCPTLLIVGGRDHQVLQLNKWALDVMLLGGDTSEKKLEVVQGATHLFEEPGTLEKVADIATDWFKKHLVKRNTL